MCASTRIRLLRYDKKIRTSGTNCKKISFGHSTRNSKINCLGPHFQASATRSRPIEGRNTAAVLPHCSECTEEPFAGGETLRSTLQPYEPSYKKKTHVEVPPDVDLIADLAKYIYIPRIYIGDATQVFSCSTKRDRILPCASPRPNNASEGETCTPRTDNRFMLHYLHLSGQITS